MTDDTALATEKRALRRHLLALRGNTASSARARAAMTHARKVLPAVGIIGLYAGFRDELDPMPLVRALWREGREIGLPVVTGPAQPLVFRRFGPDVRHVLSGYGIREPHERTPEVRPDIVLAPLVGIDRRGVRLGYGGGFYDRTLAGWAATGHRPPVYGLAFECQLAQHLPRGPYDRLLDGLVTEAGIRRFR